MERLPKSPVEIISDYMGAIFKHAIAEIEGESLDPTFLNNFERRFVLTVPAVWSDKAKSMTLEARCIPQSYFDICSHTTPYLGCSACWHPAR